jgi:signal transduction histidine kinase
VELGGLIREVLVLIGLPPGFRLEVRPPSLTVRTRRIPLECILRNLLDNAIKHHGGKKGALSIALHKGENGLDIRIEDDGRGLPAIDVEAGRQDGLGRKEGLGLAIVRQILAAEGSHLTLTPRSPGPGTDARLTWPIGSGSRRSRG